MIKKNPSLFQPKRPAKNAKKVCAVSTCNNPKDVSYHTFPKIEQMQKVWVTKCKRSDTFNPRTAHICERHFEQDAYERDLKAELLGLPPKKWLKKQAIPSLNLPTGTNSSCSVVSRQNCQKKREEDSARADIVHALLTEDFPQEQSLPPAEENIPEHPNPDDTNTSKHIQTDVAMTTDASTSCNIMANVPQLKSKVASLEKKLLSAQVQLRILKKEVKWLHSTKFQDDLVKKRLSKHHSPAQVRCLLNKGTKHQRGYSKEDTSTALIIKSSSPKLFRFLRGKKLLALPSRRTQEKYLKDFHCEPGILKDSILLLKKKLENESSPHAKLAVLCSDEMNTRKLCEWCPRKKKVYGPHSKVQIAQVRGLTHPWKQPIYASFNTTMTKDLLFHIMADLEEAGLAIIAIVFNMGNTKLMSDLELSPGKTSFCHPTNPSRDVFCFPDAPHLLKLFRNHLLDDGYEFLNANGCYASLSKSDLEALLNQDAGELRIAFKITSQAHLDCRGSARQRVRTAAQLLSGTVSKALQYIFGESMATQAEAINTVNNWFDTMNSCQVHSIKKLACGFGIHLEEQQHALNKMEKLVQTMKIKGKKSMLPFQKGFLISISAMRGLHEAVSSEGVNFIMTTHVNQDNLENVFSRIHFITGNYSHPSPMESLRCLRILMLGGNHDIVLKNPAVMDEENAMGEENMMGEERDTDYHDPSTDTLCVSKMATCDIIDQTESGDSLLSDDLMEVDS